MDEAQELKFKNFCLDVEDELNKVFCNMETHILVTDNKNNKQEVAKKLIEKINKHPAYNSALQILKAWLANTDNTGFLGFSEAQENVLLGFRTRSKIINLFAIDITQFQDIHDAKQQIYFMIYIFIETYEGHLKLKVNNEGNVFYSPKEELEVARTNLSADIFISLYLLANNENAGVNHLAQIRANKTLTPQSHLKPELFPFLISLDVIDYSFKNKFSSFFQLADTNTLLSYYQLAREISDCFEPENLYTWYNFAEKAQVMAWLGFEQEQILGAATNTSTNPFIKAIGNLLAKTLKITASTKEKIPFGYNPFSSHEINKIEHERYIDENFEMALIHSIEADSHLPLLRLANIQNKALAKGKFLGWCANALHAAANAFVSAQQRGVPVAQYTRLEFQSARKLIDWEILRQSNEVIIESLRLGAEHTISDLIEWAKKIPEARFMHESLIITAERDTEALKDFVLQSSPVEEKKQTKSSVLPATKLEKTKLINSLMDAPAILEFDENRD